MAVVFDWGDGRTYSDLPSALAGAASYGLALADDYELPGYLNTGSSRDYAHTSNISIPTFTTTNGAYTVKIYGTVGSIDNKDSMLKLSFSGSAANGLWAASMTNYGLIIENLEIYSTATTTPLHVAGAASAFVNGVYSHGTCFYGLISTNVVSVNNSILVASSGMLISAGNGFKLRDSLVRGMSSLGISADRFFADIIGSSIHGNTYGLSTIGFQNSIFNSTISGGTHAIQTAFASTDQWSFTGKDITFYSEANPTEVSSAGGIAATFGPANVTLSRVVIDDPEYAQTGDDYAWFVPDSTSPLRTGNQTFATNVIYGTNRDKFSQGGWSDAQAADLPAESDVRLGVSYDGGNLTGNVTLPTEADVKLAVTYDTLLSRTGTYDPAGDEPTAPTVTGVSVAGNSITISVTAASETDVVYGRVRKNKPSIDWDNRSESFKRTGSGDITITGLVNGIQYEVCGQTVSDVLYSDFSNSYFAVPDSDAFATSRNNSKFAIRDRTALTALHVAQRRGIKVDFENVQGSGSVNLYAVVSESSEKILDVKSGNIEYTTTVLQIPRQTNFPPLEFYPNSIVTINEKVYQVESIKGDNEDDDMASTWEVRCNVSGDCYGY
jgi:hypothetical protein